MRGGSTSSWSVRAQGDQGLPWRHCSQGGAEDVGIYGRDGGHEVAGPSGASVELERKKHVVEEVMEENSSDIEVTYAGKKLLELSSFALHSSL